MEEPTTVGVRGGPDARGPARGRVEPQEGRARRSATPTPLRGRHGQPVVDPGRGGRPARPGYATLRFNFRGVGASEGSHDKGGASRRTCGPALATLRPPARRPRGSGPAATRSGPAMSSRATRPSGPDGAARASSLRRSGCSSFDFLHGGPRAVLLVAGTGISYCPVEALDRLAARHHGGRGARVEGADHFFFGKLYPARVRRSGLGLAGYRRPGDQSRSRGSRGGVAVPAERMMRMPSSTVRPVGSDSSSAPRSRPRDRGCWWGRTR